MTTDYPQRDQREPMGHLRPFDWQAQHANVSDWFARRAPT